jgi:hypothetical protein
MQLRVYPLTVKSVDGRVLRHLHKQGQQVYLVSLNFPVTVSWYYLKREKGRLEKRFILSTRPLKARAILNGGESVDGFLVGWFKTALASFWLAPFWSRY